MMPSSRRLNVHYIALQAGFWAVVAAICAYQAALLQARGFSNTQVGVIVALRCLSGVVIQPIIGAWSDKHPQVPIKRILVLSLAISFAGGLVLLIPMGMLGTSLIFLLLGALEISAYPLLDAMAIQFIHAGVEVDYSVGRGAGSFAYAIICVALGLQAQYLGVETTLITHSALTVLLIILVVTFPAFDPAWRKPEAAKEKPRSALRLLRESPRFTLMLLGLLLGIAGVIPISIFMFNLIASRGGSEVHLGLSLFLMAAVELPAALLFNKLYKKGRAGAILAASMFFMALKVGLCYLTGTYWQVWLVQLTQMLGYGLFTPASVMYVSDVIPDADQVKGQTLMMMATNGLGGMVGNYVTGLALDAGGVDRMLLVCFSLCIAAGVVASLSAFLPRRKVSRG